jgi:hypothetical protein
VEFPEVLKMEKECRQGAMVGLDDGYDRTEAARGKNEPDMAYENLPFTMPGGTDNS